MGSRRIATTLTRCVAAAPFRPAVPHHPLPSAYILRPSTPWGTIRHNSRVVSEAKSTVYGFEQIKSLSSTPSADRILIDVREPGEFRAGAIPTAINLPIASAPEALSLPVDEFEDRFGFAKPPVEKELVFYCKAGVRSSAAAQLALQNGYGKVGEYRGSWLDWEKKVKESA